MELIVAGIERITYVIQHVKAYRNKKLLASMNFIGLFGFPTVIYLLTYWRVSSFERLFYVEFHKRVKFTSGGASTLWITQFEEVSVPSNGNVLLIQELFKVNLFHETMYLLSSGNPFMELLGHAEHSLSTTYIRQ